MSQSDGWICVRERRKPASDEGGLGGFIAYAGRPYQFIGYRLPNGTRDSSLMLYTDPEAVGTPSRLKVFNDGNEIQPITRSSNGRSFYLLTRGNGSLEILSGNTSKTPRLRAVSILSAAPGVSYSTFGVNGAAFGILQEWRGETVRMQLSDYQPDLLILSFGTNDAVAENFSEDTFVGAFATTERWIAEYAKNAAVLMILPPYLPRHDSRVRANLEILRKEVRLFAKKNGWYVWDWSRAVDVAASEAPHNHGPVYANDGIHLTGAGYSQSAKLLFDALATVF